MIEEIEQFLIEAKKQTYANESVEKQESSRLKSNDYEYKKENMTYHDTYFGGVKFMGSEIVYQNDIPLWGMNYYGVTLDENLSEDAMDQALRPALMQVGMDDIIPVRGPKEYKNKDYTYIFETKGDLTSFEGVETIYKNDIKIYELKCHGGVIK